MITIKLAIYIQAFLLSLLPYKSTKSLSKLFAKLSLSLSISTQDLSKKNTKKLFPKIVYNDFTSYTTKQMVLTRFTLK